MNLSSRAQVYRTHRQTRKPVTHARMLEANVRRSMGGPVEPLRTGEREGPELFIPFDSGPSMRAMARLLLDPVADGSRWIEVANEHGVAVTPYPAPKEEPR